MIFFGSGFFAGGGARKRADTDLTNGTTFTSHFPLSSTDRSAARFGGPSELPRVAEKMVMTDV
jgi:hypothetical protein